MVDNNDYDDVCIVCDNCIEQQQQQQRWSISLFFPIHRMNEWMKQTNKQTNEKRICMDNLNGKQTNKQTENKISTNTDKRSNHYQSLSLSLSLSECLNFHSNRQ